MLTLLRDLLGGSAEIDLLRSTYGPIALWGSPLRDIEL